MICSCIRVTFLEGTYAIDATFVCHCFSFGAAQCAPHVSPVVWSFAVYGSQVSSTIGIGLPPIGCDHPHTDEPFDMW
jgi:hypothetical protein